MLSWQITGLILAAVACSALAQIGLKAGMSQPGVQATLGAGQGPMAVALAIAASPGVWGGLLLYGFSALLWLFVLARVEVSVAYAFVALGFLLVMALGVAVFGEALTWRKVLGTLLVAAGIWLVATGGGRTAVAGGGDAPRAVPGKDIQRASP